MYSGLAGIVRRTERPSSLIALVLPDARPLLTRRNRPGGRRSTRVGILVRLRALAEAQRQVEPRLSALDGEVRHLARAHVRDNPRNVLRAEHLAAVDRDDHVAVLRELDPQRLP